MPVSQSQIGEIALARTRYIEAIECQKTWLHSGIIRFSGAEDMWKMLDQLLVQEHGISTDLRKLAKLISRPIGMAEMVWLVGVVRMVGILVKLVIGATGISRQSEKIW